MCGIFGIIGSQDYDKERGSAESLSHRGPDAMKSWRGLEDEYPVSFWHARLAILDLDERADQPRLSKDNRYVIVFNGEIYNYLELREYLAGRYGVVFETGSDTEVLIEGFTRERFEFLNRCNGMWAFSIWDRVNKTLTMCRDRFGVKPLYYCRSGKDSYVFGSEMKALLDWLDDISPSVDINYMVRNPMLYEATTQCSINGIKRVQPGCFIEVHNNRVSHGRWWNTLDHLVYSPGDYRTAVEEWRELFLDAIRLRLRSDVKVGTTLSGGLDSSCITAGIAQLNKNSGHSVKGVSCIYPGSSLNEEEYARVAAETTGIPLGVVSIDPKVSSWGLLDSLYQVEDPYLTMPLPMLETYKAIKASGITVSLDGHGADELLSGYGSLLSTISLRMTRSQIRELISIDASTRTGIYSNKDRWLTKRVLREILKSILRKSSSGRSALRRIKQYRGNNTTSDEYFRLVEEMESHDGFNGLDAFSQVLYELFSLSVLPTLLRNYDRYSMASGVETRMPFMDWRVACMTIKMPWNFKIGETYTKRILRDAFKDVLDDRVRLRRNKIGWNSPCHEWLRLSTFQEPIQRALTKRDDIPKKLLDQWEEFQRMDKPDFNAGQRAWEALLPYLWEEAMCRPN